MVWLKPPRKIVFLREKKLCNTNLLALRYIKREKALLPVDLRRSKIACVALKGVGNKEEGKREGDWGERVRDNTNVLFRSIMILMEKA